MATFRLQGLGYSGPSGTIPPPEPPQNQILPAISGTPTAGQGLTTTYGTWDGSPTSYSIQWYKNSVAIPGAINVTQLLLAGTDEGAIITVRVTATNIGGSDSATSLGVGPVAAAPVTPPVNTVLPAITGTPTVGQTLTVSTGTWTGSPSSYGYQWRRTGVNITGAISSSYVVVAADVGQAITAVVTANNGGGGTPATSNSVMGAASASRYAGTTVTSAASGTAYNYATDIPGNAVDFSTGNAGASFVTFKAWNDYLLANDLPGKIGNVTLNIPTDGHACAKGYYGYGVTGPKFVNTVAGGVVNTAKAFLYIYQKSPVIRGIEFYGFGDVLVAAPGSVSRDAGVTIYAYHGDKYSYGFRRGVPTDQGIVVSGQTQGGLALKMDSTVWPLTVGANGATFDIESCVFTNCQQAVFYNSDTHTPNNWRFVRNTIRGQAGFGYGLAGGGVSINCTTIGDFLFALNKWTGFTVAAGTPLAFKIGAGSSDSNPSRLHTMLKVGVDSQIDIAVRKQTFTVECNEAIGVEDLYQKDTVNCSAMIDIRTNNPTSVTNGDKYTGTCSCLVRRNLAQGVKGLVGQEDAQALYTKTLGMTIEYNWWEDTGAAKYGTATGTDGSETSGSLHKPPGGNFPVATTNSALWERYNVYKNMPSNSTATSNLFVSKIADFEIPYYHCGNTYIGCDFASTSNSSGMVRRTDDGHSTPTSRWVHQVDDNVFFDCVVSDLRLIRMHNSYSAQMPYTTMRNNRMVWSSRVDYTAARPMISIASSTTGITATTNRLLGSTNSWPMNINTNTATAALGYEAPPAMPTLDS